MVDEDQAILVFGERRGENHFSALDLTDLDEVSLTDATDDLLQKSGDRGKTICL